MPKTQHLTKTRYVAGLQCLRLLWWKVHEPDAPELVPDSRLQAVFDRGSRVGEAAREHVPGGTLVDAPYYALGQRLSVTRAALSKRPPAVYEASFMEDEVFVAVDILERCRGGHALVEVKSSLDTKEEHIPDVAVQLYVLRKAGVSVRRAEVMHLNRECRHPDLSNLFARDDVTEQAEAACAEIPRKIETMFDALRGGVPDVEVGPHCSEPYECPFQSRCWPRRPKHHVSTLHRLTTERAAELEAQGIVTICDLPADYEATGPAARQIRSVKAGQAVIEPELREALLRLEGPVAFLDFETVAPAIPVWRGCAPYEQVPAQFSCHKTVGRKLVHSSWLAEGPGDPRPGIARAVVDACAGATTVLAYSAPFEQKCLAGLARAVPRLGPRLEELSRRIADLLPIVRNHVYHPSFLGSFSLKAVAPALLKDAGYDDLALQDGSSASDALEALLLGGDDMTAKDRASLRRSLLAYCKRDTRLLVRLHGRLRGLAGLR